MMISSRKALLSFIFFLTLSTGALLNAASKARLEEIAQLVMETTKGLSKEEATAVAAKLPAKADDPLYSKEGDAPAQLIHRITEIRGELNRGLAGRRSRMLPSLPKKARQLSGNLAHIAEALEEGDPDADVTEKLEAARADLQKMARELAALQQETAPRPATAWDTATHPFTLAYGSLLVSGYALGWWLNKEYRTWEAARDFAAASDQPFVSFSEFVRIRNVDPYLDKTFRSKQIAAAGLAVATALAAYGYTTR